MVTENKKMGKPSSGGGNFGSSPIAKAMQESTNFQAQLRRPDEERDAPITKDLVNYWYALKSDGSSVEGIVDAVKDVVTTRELHPVGERAGGKKVYAFRPTEIDYVDQDEVDPDVTGFARVQTLGGPTKRFAIIYTIDDELVKVDDSDLSYIEVQFVGDDSLFDQYCAIRAMAIEARDTVKKLRDKYPAAAGSFETREN